MAIAIAYMHILITVVDVCENWKETSSEEHDSPCYLNDKYLVYGMLLPGHEHACSWAALRFPHGAFSALKQGQASLYLKGRISSDLIIRHE